MRIPKPNSGDAIFQPIKSKKLYEIVVERIQEMLMDGRLKIGDRLPAERDLTTKFGVSRTSIREAMRALEILGLVECRQGEGNFISGDITKTVFQPLSLLFALNHGKYENVLELREILETQAVSLAVERATDADIADLKAVLLFLQHATDENTAARLDAEFHQKIAAMTGNNLMLNLYSAISMLLEVSIKNARVYILADELNKELLMVLHQTVCDGIEQRNRSKAVNAMEEHFTLVNACYHKIMATR